MKKQQAGKVIKRSLVVLLSAVMTMGTLLANCTVAFAEDAVQPAVQELWGSDYAVTLQSGHYKIIKDSTYNKGIVIKSGETVYIEVPEGITLTAKGKDASWLDSSIWGGYTYEATAGITVEKGASLHLTGQGNVIATGGAGFAAGDGGVGNAYLLTFWYCNTWLLKIKDMVSLVYGWPGNGGVGAGAPAAGIGGNGGKAGSMPGTNGIMGGGFEEEDNNKVEKGSNGLAGVNGGNGQSMGKVYIEDTVKVTATAGDPNNCTAVSSGGKFAGAAYRITNGGNGWQIFDSVGAPGGGGGAAGTSAAIGGAGGAGGAGGSGASNSYTGNHGGGLNPDYTYSNGEGPDGRNGGAGGKSAQPVNNDECRAIKGGAGGTGGENGEGGTLYIAEGAAVNGVSGALLTQSDLGDVTNEKNGQAAAVNKLTRVTVTVKTDDASDDDHVVTVRGNLGEYECKSTGKKGEFYGYVPTGAAGFTVYVDGVDSGYPVNTDVASTSQEVNFYTCEVNVKLDGNLDAGHSVTLLQNNCLIGTMQEASTGVFSGVFLEKYDSSLNGYNVFVDGKDSTYILYSKKNYPSGRTVTCNYYTAKVTVKQDGGPWQNLVSGLNVSLQGDGKIINMTPTGNAGEFTSVLVDVDTTVYSVYVNNTPSEQTVKASATECNAEVDYFTGVIKLSLDGAAYENAAIRFENGSYAYTVESGTNSGNYCVYKIALPVKIKNEKSKDYHVSVAGTLDAGTHSVSDTNKEDTIDFVNVKYYTSSYNSATCDINENDTLYREYIVQSGMTISPAVSPYLKGMSFSCWNKTQYDENEAEDEQTGFDFTTPITANTAFYAHFIKPNVKLNGAVRCDASGAMSSNGDYYYLPNLCITGYEKTDNIKCIKAEFSNVDRIEFPTDYPSGITCEFFAEKDHSPEIAGVYTAADTLSISFSESISVSQAQEYLRKVIVKPTKDAEHTIAFTVSDSALSPYKKEAYQYTTTENVAYSKITSQTAVGTVLQSGYYYVTENVTLDGSFGGTKDAANGGLNGLAIAEDASVIIYIPKDVTLTVTGANGNAQTGGMAGILLPESAKLTVLGAGTLAANGGNGGNAGNGYYPNDWLGWCPHSRWQNGGQNFQSAGCWGGFGGYGGGGAGAGIGTDGGQGGNGGSCGGGIDVKPELKDPNKGKGYYYAGAGGNGNDGIKSSTCGDFYTYGIILKATGGSAGNAGVVNASYLTDERIGDATLSSAGGWTYGQKCWAYANYANIYDYGVYTNGILGACGGGGGAGHPGRAIGNGGTGGGAGGGGVGGGFIISTSNNQYIKSEGGKGGAGSTNGADAVSNIQSGAANNPNAPGNGGASDNTGKEITSSEATLPEAPQYTITFDATKFGGAKTVVKYDYFTGGTISLPEAVSVPGLTFKGWTVTKYGSNLNGDVTDCTKGDTKFYLASAIKLDKNTSGDIVLEPAFEEIAAKYATGNLKMTLTSAAPSVTYETYTVSTKLNGESHDVDSVVLKSGSTEYALSSNGTGEYSLITVAGKEFEIWCNGVNTGKKITSDTYAATVELISVVIDVKLNDVSTDSLGAVSLVKSGSDAIELAPVYTSAAEIKGYYVVRLAPASAASYDVYLDGKDTGKDIELSSSAASMTLDYYTITVETKADDALADVGVVTLRDKGAVAHTLTTDTSGIFLVTKPVCETVYDIYVGDENTGKTASFTSGGYKPSDSSAYPVNYRTIVINTKNNGTAQNLGTVELKEIGSDPVKSIAVPNTAVGTYEIRQLEDPDTSYQVYVGGMETDSVLKFTQTDRTCTLLYKTVNLITNLDGTAKNMGSVVLKAEDKPDITMTYQNGRYEATTLLLADYDVYVDEKDTGVNFDIENNTSVTLNYYTVHYDTAGGAADVPVDSVYLDGASVSITEDVPTKADHQFTGWKDDAGNLIAAGTSGITVSSERHTFTAVYTPLSSYNARYKEPVGEWNYAQLNDVLQIVSDNSTMNYEIELQTDAAIGTNKVIPSNAALTIKSGLTLSGDLTNRGTINLSGSLTGTVENQGTIEGCGTANANHEIVSPASIGTLKNESAGTVSGCKITLLNNNAGSLEDCHIVSGTAIAGTLLGTIYAESNVTFSSDAAPYNSVGEKTTISIAGGGTVTGNSDINAATNFTGLMLANNNHHFTMANIHARNKITVNDNQLYADFFDFTAPEDAVYDKSGKEPSFTGSRTLGIGNITKVMYKQIVKTGDTAWSSWTDWTEQKPINAGTYQVRINVADGDCYYGKNEVTDAAGWLFTITQKEAELSWSDTSLTYNESEQKPTATVSNLCAGDVCTVTVTGAQTDASDTPYTATASELSNANYKLPENPTTTFTIAKADQAAPNVTANAETIDKKADGTINDLTTAMEYKLSSDTDYIPVTDVNVELPVGSYDIRYKEDSNHNPGADATVQIESGRKLTVTLPAEQIGYSLSVNHAANAWHESPTVTFKLAKGYSKVDGFAVKVDGTKVELTQTANGETYTLPAMEADAVVTVEGVADITRPTGEISIDTNLWRTFLNKITFGYFFKETKDVVITGADTGSGVGEIFYSVSETPLTEEQVKALTDWTAYKGRFPIAPNTTCVVYAKIIDKSGNEIHISSDGLVFEHDAPLITGISGETTYCHNVEFTVADENLDIVKANDVVLTPLNGKYTLPSYGVPYNVVATDKAGNSTTIASVTIRNGHAYSADWTCDETYHWHAATCDHTTEVSGKAVHTYSRWTINKDAKNKADGTKSRICSVCGYKQTEETGELPEEYAEKIPDFVKKSGLSMKEILEINEKSEVGEKGIAPIVYSEEQIEEAREKAPVIEEDAIADAVITGDTVVNVGEGSILIIVDSVDKNNNREGDVIEGFVATSAENVLDACLTEEEHKLAAESEDVVIRVVITNVEDKVPEDDAKQIEKETDELAKSTDGIELGEYVDITLQKRLGNSDWERMKELNEELEVSFDVPKGLIAADRTYFVMRNHEGTCDLLSDLDDTGESITIATGLFSTYAILYTDAPIAPYTTTWIVNYWPFLILAVAIIALIIFMLARRKHDEDNEAGVNGDGSH